MVLWGKIKVVPRAPILPQRIQKWPQSCGVTYGYPTGYWVPHIPLLYLHITPQDPICECTHTHTHTHTHVCMTIPCEGLDSVLYFRGLPLWMNTGCSYCIHKHVWALCLSASLWLGFQWNGFGSNHTGHFTLLMRTSCEDLLIIIKLSIYTFLERTVGASWFNLWCMSSISITQKKT